MWFVDDPDYVSPLGLECWQHRSLSCRAFGYIGYSNAEVEELTTKCFASCNAQPFQMAEVSTSVARNSDIHATQPRNKPQQDQGSSPLGLAFSVAAKKPGECFDGRCSDDPNYKTKLGLNCERHQGFICERFASVGFSWEEATALVSRCPCSCNVECIATSEPTFVPTTTPTKVPSASPTTQAPTLAPSLGPTTLSPVTYSPTSIPRITHPSSSSEASNSPTAVPSSSPVATPIEPKDPLTHYRVNSPVTVASPATEISQSNAIMQANPRLNSISSTGVPSVHPAASPDEREHTSTPTMFPVTVLQSSKQTHRPSASPTLRPSATRTVEFLPQVSAKTRHGPQHDPSQAMQLDADTVRASSGDRNRLAFVMVATAVCFFAIIVVFYTVAKRRRDVDEESNDKKKLEGSQEGQQQDDLTATGKKGKVMRISTDGPRFQAVVMSISTCSIRSNDDVDDDDDAAIASRTNVLSPVNEGIDVHNIDLESPGIPSTLARSRGSNETRIEVNDDASAVEVDVMPGIDIGCKRSE